MTRCEINLIIITLDPLYFEVHIFLATPDPPYMYKNAKMCYFWTLLVIHFKDAPKVGVHCEKFNIGNVAQIFFGDFYICWNYVISFLQHFPIKNWKSIHWKSINN